MNQIVQASNENGDHPNHAVVTPDFRLMKFEEFEKGQFTLVTVWLVKYENEL
jgi:hypothetical protein